MSQVDVVLVGDGSDEACRRSGPALARQAAALGGTLVAVTDGEPLARLAERLRADWCVVLDGSVLPGHGLVAAHLGRLRGAGCGVVVLGPIEVLGADRARPSGGVAEGSLSEHARAAHWTEVRGLNVGVARGALRDAAGTVSSLGRSASAELVQALSGLGLQLVCDPAARAWRLAPLSPRVRAAERGRCGELAAGLALARKAGAFAAMPEPLDRGSLGGVLVRRALLAARCPPALPGLLGARMRGPVRPRMLARLGDDLAFWTGVRRAAGLARWRTLARGPVILMYHAVGAAGEPADTYVVPARRFARHMRLLRLLRRPVIDLEDYLVGRADGDPGPAGAVIVTADDGYADNLERAAPVLHRLGLPATVFVVSGAPDGRNGWDASGALRHRPLLDGPGLAALAALGVRVGAHTRHHPRLTGVNDRTARAEIGGSRQDLERSLGRPVRTFSYPHGRNDARVRALVAEAGFLGACTSRSGVNAVGEPVHALRRAEIKGTDGVARLAAALLVGTARPSLGLRSVGEFVGRQP